MGLHFLGVFRIAFLYREARVHIEKKPAGLIRRFRRRHCLRVRVDAVRRPVLAAILFVAGAEDTVARGALLLAVYALGIGIPFMLAALFAGPFLRLMQRFKRHMGTVEKVMGALLVITGILFLTGQMSEFSYWLLETFPGLARVEELVAPK